MHQIVCPQPQGTEKVKYASKYVKHAPNNVSLPHKISLKVKYTSKYMEAPSLGLFLTPSFVQHAVATSLKSVFNNEWVFAHAKCIFNFFVPDGTLPRRAFLLYAH